MVAALIASASAYVRAGAILTFRALLRVATGVLTEVKH
jgi:hypothetical protein